MNETKLSEETAQDILEQFIDYYEIDPADMSDDVGEAITTSLVKIRKAIQKGRIEINIDSETITIKQHLKKPHPGIENPLIYKEIVGTAKTPIKPDVSHYIKIYTFLGALSGEGLSNIQKLRGADLSLAESLGTVFLQV